MRCRTLSWLPFPLPGAWRWRVLCYAMERGRCTTPGVRWIWLWRLVRWSINLTPWILGRHYRIVRASNASRTAGGLFAPVNDSYRQIHGNAEWFPASPFKQKRSRSFENKSATQALLDRLRYEDFDAGRGVRYPRCNYDGPTEEVSTFGL